MPDLIPTSRGGIQPARPASRVSRSAARGLARLEEQTLLRIAGVQGEGMVQTEKVREVDSLTREAMTGHAMLRQWGNTLAGGDPFLADELKFFTDAARLGKGEIIADTIDSFCRESRR